MRKIAGMMMVLIGVAGLAMAGTAVPEIDPGSAVAPFALLSGAMLIIRTRRKN
jgi:hypothetical protein